jgi:hypothetical protein
METNMNQDQQQKMFEYIDALEKTNKQLVFSLKLYVELLSIMRPDVQDHQKWQSMLKEFAKIITVGEKIGEKKTYH